METQLTSIELNYLIKEFKEIIGSKVDKIYHPAKKELLVQFHVSGKGKRILRVLAPNLIFLTEKKQPAEKPSGFCMFLRKTLEGARLKDIKQIGSERVIEFCFEAKGGKYFLIIELFSKGNIVICDKEHKIIALAEKQKWKDRTIEIGENYRYPEKEYDFFKIKEDEFNDFIRKSKKDSVVKALASELGLGGKYAEEVCLISEVNKNKKLKDIEKKEIKKLFDNLKKIINRKTENLSKKIESLLKSDIKPAMPKEHKKLVNRIKKQEELIDNFKREIDENNQKAEMVYQKYKIVDEIIKEIRKAREKHSWKEIEEKLEGNELIKKVIPKDSKVIIEL